MKKLILSIILLILTVNCSTIKYVPIKGDTVVEYRDTTVYRDSIIYTPIETIKEIVPQMDTLSMETSLATATAYLDTTNRVLRGEIHNKKGITEQIKYKEKIIYRDSVVTQEIPVEVQVEKIQYRHTFFDKLCWLIAGLSCSILLYTLIKKYAKRWLFYSI